MTDEYLLMNEKAKELRERLENKFVDDIIKLNLTLSTMLTGTNDRNEKRKHIHATFEQIDALVEKYGNSSEILHLALNLKATILNAVDEARSDDVDQFATTLNKAVQTLVSSAIGKNKQERKELIQQFQVELGQIGKANTNVSVSGTIITAVLFLTTMLE